MRARASIASSKDRPGGSGVDYLGLAEPLRVKMPVPEILLDARHRRILPLDPIRHGMLLPP